jgi:hypothetical protein
MRISLAGQVEDLARAAWDRWGADCSESWEWAHGWGAGSGWMAVTIAAESESEAIADARQVLRLVRQNGTDDLSESARGRVDAIRSAMVVPSLW